MNRRIAMGTERERLEGIARRAAARSGTVLSIDEAADTVAAALTEAIAPYREALERWLDRDGDTNRAKDVALTTDTLRLLEES